MKNYREVLGLEESIVKQCENIVKNGGLTGLSWRGKYLLHPETHKLIFNHEKTKYKIRRI